MLHWATWHGRANLLEKEETGPSESAQSMAASSSSDSGGSNEVAATLAVLEQDEADDAGGKHAVFAANWENPFGTNGIFARMGEYIPFVNGGIQRLHELNGNDEALSRARRQNPIGPDGYLTHVAEHLPLVNHVVQEVHRTTGEDEALVRARDRNPIGTNGFVTKVVEHIPLFSDGVMALHKMQGHDNAAERARAHTLQKLLSKDGAITRLAELLPVSNLFAAVMHEMSGNREEAIRALDLIESWQQALKADGPFAKVAELLPGADAFVFAIHVQGGYYAQAIRSITKTTWVNFEVHQVVLFVNCTDLSHLLAKDLQAINIEVIPRQLSLLVGASDMLANFLRMDREGHRRVFRTVVDVEGLYATRPNTMELTKELLKAIFDDKVSSRIEYFTGEVPNYMTWLIEVMNRWVPVWRKRRSFCWLMLPNKLPLLPEKLVDELQKAVPHMTISAGELPPVRPVPRRKAERRALLPQAGAASVCFAATGCCGLGVKAAGVACAAGLLAGAVELGRRATRFVMSCLDDWNSACWSETTESQPEESPREARRPQQEQAGSMPNDVDAGGGQAGVQAGAEADATRPGADVPPRGLVLELTASDCSRLAALVRAYYFEDVLRNSVGACCLRLVEPVMRAFVRSLVGTSGAVMPVVFEVELEEWEVELQDYSWNLRLPAMRFAIVLHLALDGGVPKCKRAFFAFPDALVQRLLQTMRDQMLEWDLRELDDRFAGFTQPVHVSFELEAQWTSATTLRLDAFHLKSRLDLPH